MQQLQTGLEAIAHQTDQTHFLHVVELFAALKEEFRTTKINQLNRKSEIIPQIEKAVFDFNGVLLKLTIEDDSSIDTWVESLDLKENHVLALGKYRGGVDEGKVAKLFSRLSPEVLHATIDLKAGKVTGFFSQILVRVSITAGTLKQLDADQVAARFYHEVGHVMAYFEYFKALTIFNINLMSALDEFTHAENPTYRLQIVNDFKKSSKLSLANGDVVAENGSTEEFLAVVLSEAARNPRFALGSDVYDERSWEAASDQYVSRIGGGRALAIAIHRGYSSGWSSSYQNLFTYGLSQTFSFFAHLAMFTASFGVLTLLYVWLTGNPYRNSYDDPVQRITRIRNDTMAALKNPRIPTAHVKRILEDLDAIDKARNEGKDREGWYKYLATLVSSSVREQRRLLLDQKQLEYLANNDLSRHAAQFKLMSE